MTNGTNTSSTPQCPDGYGPDPNNPGQCLPISGPISVTVTDPATGTFTVNDISAAAVDPHKAGALTGLGFLDDGIIERFIAALFHAILIFAAPLINLAVSLADSTLGLVADALTSVQGESTHGFWTLSAALLTDLFGIEVDGDSLAADFNNKGRLSAVTALGAKIVNILAAEFVGIPQTAGASGFDVPAGQGVGGLPVATMSPEQGVAAAQAFLGFATEFAVREGNVEGVASYLPWGLGEVARSMAVNFARGVNLGRMGRIALRPLFQTLVATPLGWAINKQYRPKLMSVQELLHAELAGLTLDVSLEESLARDGYSDNSIAALKAFYGKLPSKQQLDVLHLVGSITDEDYARYLHLQGYSDTVIALIQQAEDLLPARHASLAAAQHFVHEYVTGVISGTQLQQALTGGGAIGVGTLLLTPQEVKALTGIAGALTAYPRTQMSLSQWETSYINATVTLQEFEDYLTRRGYSQDQVNTLGIDLLIRAQKAEAAAAKKAASTAGSPGGPIIPQP